MTDPNAYRRAYRRGNPTRDRLGKRARRRAEEELKRRYDDEYRRLVDEHRAALGLPPASRGRPQGN